MGSTQITTERTSLRVRAPGLLAFVDLLFAQRRDPENRRLHIQRALLEKEGADRCVCCQTPLSLDGFSAVKTAYGSERTLTCGGCRTVFVLDDEHIC